MRADKGDGLAQSRKASQKSWEDFGGKDLMGNIWWEIFDGKYLPGEIWQEAFGRKRLAGKIWGGKIWWKYLARNIWRERFGEKDLTGKILEGKIVGGGGGVLEHLLIESNYK
jgi:hypothetical protein